MSPWIATAICAAGILGLFWLDRGEKVRASVALWIPVIWLSLACSRSVGQWLKVNPLDTPDQLLEGSPTDRLVYASLLALGLIVLICRGSRSGRLLRANGPLLLFFLYCAMSILWSDYPDVAFKRWIKALGDLVMVLVVLTDREPLAAFKRLLARMTYVLIPLSILFIKYYPELGTRYSLWGGKAENLGVTTNKNALGVICLCLGLGAFWRFLTAYDDRNKEGRKRRLLVQAVILAMVLWLFRTANSVTSSSCFLMGSILIAATKLRLIQRRPVVVHLLIAAMLAVSVSVLFFGVSPEALATMGRNPTLTDRTEVWKELLTLVRNPLTGAGFESFWLGSRLQKLWNIYWWHPNEAHNGYLEIYLNLGWTGVILLAAVLVKGYRTLFAAWSGSFPLGDVRVAYFLVGLSYNFTEAAFFRMLAPAWLFLLFAIVSVPPVSLDEIRLSAEKQFQRAGDHHRELLAES